MKKWAKKENNNFISFVLLLCKLLNKKCQQIKFDFLCSTRTSLKWLFFSSSSSTYYYLPHHYHHPHHHPFLGVGERRKEKDDVDDYGKRWWKINKYIYKSICSIESWREGRRWLNLEADFLFTAFYFTSICIQVCMSILINYSELSKWCRRLIMIAAILMKFKCKYYK